LEKSADYLLVRRQPEPILLSAANTPEAAVWQAPIPAPVVHEGLSDEVHRVGEGAWRREVRVFPTPEGYRLDCGETVNPPGHWSSWPRHQPINATTHDHQEVFFVITPGWGLVRRQGWYATPGDVDDVRLVQNGDALVMPLGSHPIVASPESWLFYWWCYESTALKKTYNAFATDVQTYRS
jgi:5-deoxy-glucuronate isomerase